MAARGGRSGNQEAFDGARGSGKDYTQEWAGKRLHSGMRPESLPEIDYDGTSNAENIAKNVEIRARQKAFDTAFESQKAAAKAAGEAKPAANPIIKSPKGTKNPTNRTPGVRVEQTMGIKEFGQRVAGLHSILSAHHSTVGSVELRPEAEAQVGIAKNHLDDAKFHIGEAEKARRGVIIGNKRFSGDAEAGKHYIAGLRSLRMAHDALGSEHVQHAAYVHNLTAELPTDHLETTEAASKTIPILKGGKSFKAIPFGGAKIDPNIIDVKEAEKLVGKSTDATRKIRAGQTGTKRQDKFNVVSGKEDKSLGGLPGAGDRTVGRKGAVSTPMNPMRPASRQRTVSDRLRGANMARYQTPKFEGKPDGEAK